MCAGTACTLSPIEVFVCVCVGRGCTLSHSEVYVCDVICYALIHREVCVCVGALSDIRFTVNHTEMCF